MSWTYRNQPEMLRAYPELANMGLLLESWPSLRMTIQHDKEVRESGKSEQPPKTEPDTKS